MNKSKLRDRDTRKWCKLCMRKAPNFCKKHRPVVTITETTLYTQKQLNQKLAQARKAILEEVRREVIGADEATLINEYDNNFKLKCNSHDPNKIKRNKLRAEQRQKLSSLEKET